jgi:hypothetical protein
MAYVYTDGVNVAKPAGSDPANVDDDMRAIKLAYNERLDDVLGVTWASDDPVLPSKIKGVADFYGTGKQAVQAVVDMGNITGTTAIDFDVRGNFIKATLTGNVTFTVSNMRPGTSYVLILIQDGTGGRTITWPSGIRWPSGTAPTLVTTASRVSVISIVPYSSTVGLAFLGGTNFNVS